MYTTKDKDIQALCRAIDIVMEHDRDHYCFRYVGKKFNQEAPDLILEFESDEEHYIDDLEQALNEFVLDLTRRKINVVGIGITEVNLLMTEVTSLQLAPAVLT